MQISHSGFGAYLALPGRVQTVLRAEIYAFLVIILFAEPLAQLTIFTDSFVAFRALFSLSSQPLLPRSHTTLWRRLLKCIRSKQLTIRPVWIRAHQLRIGIRAPLVHVIGNECADALACRGAKVSSVSHGEVETYFRYRDLVTRIQHRLVYVLQCLICDFPRTTSYQDAPKEVSEALPLSLFTLCGPHIS